MYNIRIYETKNLDNDKEDYSERYLTTISVENMLYQNEEIMFEDIDYDNKDNIFKLSSDRLANIELESFKVLKIYRIHSMETNKDNYEAIVIRIGSI